MGPSDEADGSTKAEEAPGVASLSRGAGLLVLLLGYLKLLVHDRRGWKEEERTSGGKRGREIGRCNRTADQDREVKEIEMERRDEGGCIKGIG